MPQQGGFPPPQQGGYPAPQPPQQGGFPPPQQGGYPAPQPPQQGGFPPPQQGGFPAAPAGRLPATAAGRVPPPQQGGFPPPQQGGFPPPQQGGFPPPQQAQPQPYGQPPQQQPYGQPPTQPQAQPYGQPQAQPYGQPQANPFGAPQQNLPGPLDDMARGLPQSAPGTLFGFPLSKLREAGVQRTALMLAGIALLASIAVPVLISPALVFPFSSGMPFFEMVLWPALAGAGYLFFAAAPQDMRSKIPPIVLQWLPFGIAYAGLIISKMGFGALAVMGGGGGGGGLGIGGLYTIGYATLVFGLLARLAQPSDAIARFIIMAGSAMLFPGWLDMFSIAFKFSDGVLGIMMFLWFLVVTLGVLSILFVINGVRFGTYTVKLPPALQALDAFVPIVTAVLIAWLPVQQVLFGVGLLIKGGGLSAITIMAHGLLPVLAYFGVLMLTAPAAYDEFKALISGQKGGGAPPQAPPGGGYPPQGGGYPPQGGGYPPQGGGYPPQQGGGWPQQ